MMEMTESGARATPPRGSTVAQWARVVYLLVAGLFAGGIIAQVFFAGAGVLVDPRYFALHTSLGHLIELLPVLLLVTGLIARLPRRLLALSACVFVLFMLQYVFLYAVGRLTGLPLLRSLHAVNALVLFWLAVDLIQRAWRLIQADRRAALQRRQSVPA